MTNGSHIESQSEPRILSIRSLPLKIVKPDDDTNELEGTSSESEPSPKGTPEIMPKHPVISSLTRQVSHDGLASCSDTDTEKKKAACDVGRISPIRSVTQFDKVSASEIAQSLPDTDSTRKYIPPQPNPLHSRGIFHQHIHSLRLEAMLHPMRLILSRLMTNLTYNRKGVFNTPVDPVALNLPDYFTTIKTPMDLGTIKNRLHSVAYKSRQAVADDVRLCFTNAMLYNPPQNAIHIAAKELLKYFEDQLSSFCPEIADYTLLNIKSSPLSSDTSMHHSEDSPCISSVTKVCTNASPQEHTASTEIKANCEGVVGRTCSTRTTNHDDIMSSGCSKKRKKRGSKLNPGHSCQWCNGNICYICEQGCLPLQPSLLICNGPQCIGAKIRKGVTYFTTQDGSSQYCERCYVGLPAILPGKSDDGDACRYKRNLLKRKNDEDIVEQWLTCVNCESSVHRICVMHNPFVHSSDNYRCPSCYNAEGESAHEETSHFPIDPLVEEVKSDMYSFITGEDLPVPLSSIAAPATDDHYISLRADLLPENAVSRFIEDKVRDRMATSDCPNGEKTITVRTISECDRFFRVPDVIRKHFRLLDNESHAPRVIPPSKVLYRSKAIALFQKFDGLDVCIFCMYVQEYDGSDEFDSGSDKECALQEKRVYISYIDSVEHFRPRTIRTAVYQEVLTAYLATARLRGYETAHIWACPPSRGNSFVFWNHPSAQRTPNMERLTAWYHATLSRAMECGVVTDVKSLYETSFEVPLRRIEESARKNNGYIQEMPCPPLLEGDFWIEEALRIHNITFSRLLKDSSMPLSASHSQSSPVDGTADVCPTTQLATMFREKILMHPLSKAFRRPVNAAALKLNDYHTVISKPMDLGTVYTRCLLGEYKTLLEFTEDVNLVFSNAKTFNPAGHIVHMNAIELNEIFFTELNSLTETWHGAHPDRDGQHSWETFGSTSLSLYPNASNCNSHHSEDSVLALPDNVEAPCDKIQATLPTDGPEQVRHLMAGNDVWLLEKKVVVPPKAIGIVSGCKRGRKGAVDSTEDPPSKRRRQTWLGEEVGAVVRRMRTSFFKCSLIDSSHSSGLSQVQCDRSFRSYIGSHKIEEVAPLPSSRVADARHAFLEVSQFRNLEFDTLRRAKYSTAILLYHLRHEAAPGLIPECTSCGKEIEGVRWHRICKVVESRSTPTTSNTGRKPKSTLPFTHEELCISCFSSHTNQKEFLPVQVSL